MAELKLALRFYWFAAPEGQAQIEAHTGRREIQVSIPVEQAALVLVDVWDRHYMLSHQERAVRIVREKMAPLVQAGRAAGLTIIHAPAPGAAQKYPQWVRYADHADLFGAERPPEDWPPREFRERQGEYAQFSKNWPPPPLKDLIEEQQRTRLIMPEVAPQPDDFVVATGAQLHRLCKHRRLLHLFYAGFAANMCVLYRDYGLRAMANRGYNCILVRDCTTAIEAAETVDSLLLTEAAIYGVEMLSGFSVTTEALIAACQGAK